MLRSPPMTGEESGLIENSRRVWAFTAGSPPVVFSSHFFTNQQILINRYVWPLLYMENEGKGPSVVQRTACLIPVISGDSYAQRVIGSHSGWHSRGTGAVEPALSPASRRLGASLGIWSNSCSWSPTLNHLRGPDKPRKQPRRV